MLIGIGGLAGSGKTTFAQMLQDHYEGDGYDVQRLSIASPIRQAIEECLGVFKDEMPAAYRHLAQYVGQYMRDLDPDWWVAAAKMSLDQDPNVITIIDDVRYANEYAWIGDEGKLVFIHGRVPKEDMEKGVYKHESEAVAMGMSEALWKNPTAPELDPSGMDPDDTRVPIIRNTKSKEELNASAYTFVSKNQPVYTD